RARTFAAESLADLGYPHMVEDAKIIISELVTNAATETQKVAPAAKITVHLGLQSGKPILEVHDCSTNPPEPDGDDPLADHGRGALITPALAADWGYEILPAGKVIWALLR